MTQFKLYVYIFYNVINVIIYLQVFGRLFVNVRISPPIEAFSDGGYPISSDNTCESVFKSAIPVFGSCEPDRASVLLLFGSSILFSPLSINMGYLFLVFCVFSVL